MNPTPLQFFDREAERRVVERNLPHWSQAGTVCFITWRAHDSMPSTVLDQWHNDRVRWLTENGIDSTDSLWYQNLQSQHPNLALTFRKEFWNRWHDALDAGHGECVLRQPGLAQIVATSLHHFDADRYLLLDFVVMPNHAHVLAAFPDAYGLLAQCESWKHYTATQINRRLQRRGRFWQQDGFDHLARSEEQFAYLRDYIARNPTKANLHAGEYVHYSKPL